MEFQDRDYKQINQDVDYIINIYFFESQHKSQFPQQYIASVNILLSKNSHNIDLIRIISFYSKSDANVTSWCCLIEIQFFKIEKKSPKKQQVFSRRF
ncbi:unnamed protein product [Paramecium octaurelia]|uniref:Uncharacterized protein n=1 Tax=Paramecium octaurelia TaxID=43137 RepID=A0A8S1RZF1_PAROT|nr:unnamed protein product [Paramecium octaurelia]